MTTPPQPQDSGTISAQVLLKLGEMSTQLAVIVVRLEAVPDHESRIRSLERWRYGISVSLVASIASAVVAVLKAMGH